MNKQEKLEHQEQAEGYARQIHALVNECGGTFEVIIHKTSQSNLTYYYSVRLWYYDTKRNETSCWNLNYILSEYLGFGNLKGDYLKGGGLGFDRGHEAVYSLGAAVSRLLKWDTFKDIKARFGVEYQENPSRYFYVYTNKFRTIC